MSEAIIFEFPYNLFLKQRLEFVVICQDDLEALIMRLVEYGMIRLKENWQTKVVEAIEAKRTPPKEPKTFWVRLSHGQIIAKLYKYDSAKEGIGAKHPLSLSKSTVRKAVNSLIEKGFLVMRSKPGDEFGAPIYTLHHANVQAALKELPSDPFTIFYLGGVSKFESGGELENLELPPTDFGTGELENLEVGVTENTSGELENSNIFKDIDRESVEIEQEESMSLSGESAAPSNLSHFETEAKRITDGRLKAVNGTQYQQFPIDTEAIPHALTTDDTDPEATRYDLPAIRLPGSQLPIGNTQEQGASNHDTEHSSHRTFDLRDTGASDSTILPGTHESSEQGRQGTDPGGTGDVREAEQGQVDDTLALSVGTPLSGSAGLFAVSDAPQTRLPVTASPASSHAALTDTVASSDRQGGGSEILHKTPEAWEAAQKAFLENLRIEWDALPRTEKQQRGGRWDVYKKQQWDAWKAANPKPKDEALDEACRIIYVKLTTKLRGYVWDSGGAVMNEHTFIRNFVLKYRREHPDTPTFFEEVYVYMTTKIFKWSSPSYRFKVAASDVYHETDSVLQLWRVEQNGHSKPSQNGNGHAPIDREIGVSGLKKLTPLVPRPVEERRAL